MNKYNFPLLITSSVDPVVKVKVSDKTERLLQYKLSILRWVVETKFNKIVLIDNTNTKIFSEYEISQFMDYGITIEQIISPPNPLVGIKGASYGISEIYEIAIKKSKLINESNHFAKITGRLFVENMNDLISDVKVNESYLIRWLYKGFFRFKPGRFDERFAIYNKKYYIKNLLPLKKQLDDSKDQWIEIVYNKHIEKNKHDIKSFKAYPRIVGISGHQGKPYDGNNFIRWQVKDIINKIYGVLSY